MPRVAETIADWIADKRLGSKRKGDKPVRERTIQILTENFDADIRDRIDDAKIGKLTPEAIRACIDAPRKRGALGSASQVYRTLRGLVTFAIKRQLIDGANPTRGIENPRPYRPASLNAATDSELVALLRALDESDHEATKLAVEFQLLTGARPGEVRLAKWSEVNAQRCR